MYVFVKSHPHILFSYAICVRYSPYSLFYTIYLGRDLYENLVHRVQIDSNLYPIVPNCEQLHIFIGREAA